jgi:hypothetical protein
MSMGSQGARVRFADVPPPEVLRNPGQDPISNFDGDGVGPNANSIMTLIEDPGKDSEWIMGMPNQDHLDDS